MQNEEKKESVVLSEKTIFNPGDVLGISKAQYQKYGHNAEFIKTDGLATVVRLTAKTQFSVGEKLVIYQENAQDRLPAKNPRKKS